MTGWHHWLDGRESEWTPGVGDGQGGLACCDSWGRKESDTTEWLIWSDLILSEWASGFPYFLQYKSEFVIKEFMIWAAVSSQSCFCWLYWASPLLAVKNIINLISVLTIWWCPCTESSLVLLEEGVIYDQHVPLAKLCYPLPALFFIPRPNLPVTPGISWLPTFAFQSPIMKRSYFGGVSSRSCRFS